MHRAGRVKRSKLLLNWTIALLDLWKKVEEQETTKSKREIVKKM